MHSQLAEQTRTVAQQALTDLFTWSELLGRASVFLPDLQMMLLPDSGQVSHGPDPDPDPDLVYRGSELSRSVQDVGWYQPTHA
jgi:hypothetical protein